MGGTGRMGGGLALRLVRNHAVIIGSRSSDKAGKIAEELTAIARGFYKDKMQGDIKGTSNADAIKQSEIVIVTIPPEFTIYVMREFRECFRPEQIVVSTVVSMKKRKGIFLYTPLSGKYSAGEETKSAAELTQEIIKPTRVVSAFHTIPAAYLSSLDEVLNVDVFVAGNDDSAISEVSKLVCDIPNFRPLKVGPLQNSRLIESMVPLLLNAATLNNLEEPSIRVVPWIPTSYGACR